MIIKRFYVFDQFRLNVTEKLLLRGREEIKLSLQTFELLLELVEKKGQVIDSHELIKRFWGEVSDPENKRQYLFRLINELRNKLGDKVGEPKYIETLPKRGYRFIAEVQEIYEDESGQLIEPPLIVEPIADAVTEIVEKLGQSDEYTSLSTTSVSAAPSAPSISSSLPNQHQPEETSSRTKGRLEEALDGASLIVNGLVNGVYRFFEGAAGGVKDGIGIITRDVSDGILQVSKASSGMWRALPLIARWGLLVIVGLLLASLFKWRVKWYWYAISIVTSLVVVLFYLWWRGRKPKERKVKVDAIAVLPLTLLNSQDSCQELGLGTHNLLLARLKQKLPGVRICDATRYRGAEYDLKEIGKQLHVDAVLRGTIQLAETRIAVTTQLVSTKPGEEIIWANPDPIIVPFTNNLDVQDLVSQREAEDLFQWHQKSRKNKPPKEWQKVLSHQQQARLRVRFRRLQRSLYPQKAKV
jgi:DNA-binding winged helix-turn-helix (wHTH) protein/TolB-like protein